MTHNIQKVLITGCSYSANNEQSGWKENNLDKTYHGIIEAKTGWKITNRAMGGCSNREIAQRTVENCLSDHYDFCIVQWSSLHRFWLYEELNNVDDETQILPSAKGRMTVGNAPYTIEKLLVSHYLNDYMALKHWLHDQIMIQSFLNKNCIPYVFVRGSINYIPELETLAEQWPKDNIPSLNIPSCIKDLLNFDDNSDDYLYKKLSSLILAYLSIDKSNCIGYNRIETIYGLDPTLVRDYADDGAHPGHLVNTAISNAILHYIEKKYKF